MIMGLDLSTKSTGIAVFDDNNKLHGYKCVTASSTDLIKRIKKIMEGIQEVLDANPTITTVVVEEVRPENGQYGPGNIKTHKALMYLQGQLVFLLHDNFPSIRLEFIYPSEWRSNCKIKTGRGIKRETQKKYDIDYVKDMFNEIVNDDIADAIGIAQGWINKQQDAEFKEW